MIVTGQTVGRLCSERHKFRRDVEDPELPKVWTEWNQRKENLRANSLMDLQKDRNFWNWMSSAQLSRRTKISVTVTRTNKVISITGNEETALKECFE